jgi:valyl-tRNA synthetase
MQSRLHLATKEIRLALDNYKFNEGANILYRFVWNEFCDIGIELSKADKDSIVELGAIMKETLKLISPFMPFISEYNYHRLSGSSLENGDSVCVMAYPANEKQDKKIEKTFNTIIEAIKSIRRLKVLANMESQKIDTVFLQFKDKIDESLVKQFVPKMVKVLNVNFTDKKLDNAIVDIGESVVSYLQTKDIDLTPLVNKLNKQKEKTQKEVDKLSNLLNNENFVKNATKEVVEKNNLLLKEATEKMQNIINQLSDIS